MHSGRHVGAALFHVLALGFWIAGAGAATVAVEVEAGGVKGQYSHLPRSLAVPHRRLVRQEARHHSATIELELPGWRAAEGSAAAELLEDAAAMAAATIKPAKPAEANKTRVVKAQANAEDDGDDGGPPAGPAAIMGVAGPAGERGSTGPDADVAQGQNGTKGARGPDGPKGKAGRDATGLDSAPCLTQTHLYVLLLMNLLVLACVYACLKQRVKSNDEWSSYAGYAGEQAPALLLVILKGVDPHAVVEDVGLHARFQEAVAHSIEQELGGAVAIEDVYVQFDLPGDGTLQASVEVQGSAADSVDDMRHSQSLVDTLSALLNGVEGVSSATTDGGQVQVEVM